MSRISTLSAAVGLGLAGLIATAPTGADVPRYQMLNLNYSAVNYYLNDGLAGPYTQSFELILNPCDGTFSGDGDVPGYGESFTEGSINGARISYVSTYDVPPQTDYAVTVNNAVLSSDYSFTGLWSDN